jgi:hypothetical protein
MGCNHREGYKPGRTPLLSHTLIVDIDRNGRIMKIIGIWTLDFPLYAFFDGWNVWGICRKRPTIFPVVFFGPFPPFLRQTSSIRDTKGKKNKRE